MRIFALSDLHVDYDANMQWVRGVSRFDHVDDMLILAGDISHRLSLVDASLGVLARCFRMVLFVPGNHDLWVMDGAPGMDSLAKFEAVMKVAADCGVHTGTVSFGGWQVVPLLGWYDGTFGQPVEELRQVWMDFHACRWPAHLGLAGVAEHFTRLNEVLVRQDGTFGRQDGATPDGAAGRRITVSHFLPRIDLVPDFVPARYRTLTPVLGSTRLERQLRQVGPTIHVYGHSHINQSVMLDGVRYVNNALGYPQEKRITTRQLLCIADASA